MDEIGAENDYTAKAEKKKAVASRINYKRAVASGAY